MVFIGGCVSMAQLDTVNTNYRIAQEQLADSEKRGAELQRVLEDSKKEIDQCLLDQDALKKQIDTMRDTNNLLSLKIDALNQTIIKKPNTITELHWSIKRKDQGQKQENMQDLPSKKDLVWEVLIC